MNKTLRIARREYDVTVRRKSFLITALLMPVFIAGISVVPALLAKRAMEGGKGEAAKKVALIDETGEVYPRAKKNLEEEGRFKVEEVSANPETLEEKQNDLKERTQRKELDAYLIIGKKVVSAHKEYQDSPDHKIRYYSRNVADFAQQERICRAVVRAIIDLRLEKEGIDPAVTAKASGYINVETMEISKGEEKKSQGITKMFGAFGFMMLLFFGLQITGQTLMQGVIEEKNSKIMEVLLSSVTPRQLMTGKILGLGGAGLTVITLWSIVGYWAARFRHFDVASLPNLGFFVIFFLLGYAFYGTLMSAVGSVCNSEKEAQQMLAPIMLLLVIPLVVWFYIAQRPEGTMARTLSMIPFTIPTVMMLRIGLQTPPGGEIAISIGVMLVSIPIVMWASVRVFRTGILMYGKKPRLREIIRWIRHK